MIKNNDQEAQPIWDSKNRKREKIEAINYFQETLRESSQDDDYDRGFSLLGLVESMLSVVANGLSTVVNSIVGTEKKNLRSNVNRINYRNYQLIRVFPNTEDNIADLRDLRDAEPEDIKFWSFPTLNRFTSLRFSFLKNIINYLTYFLYRYIFLRTSDMIVAPDLVADVKDYLRDKKIDFKVLISDIQVKLNACFILYINTISQNILNIF